MIVLKFLAGAVFGSLLGYLLTGDAGAALGALAITVPVAVGLGFWADELL